MQHRIGNPIDYGESNQPRVGQTPYGAVCPRGKDGSAVKPIVPAVLHPTMQPLFSQLYD